MTAAAVLAINGLFAFYCLRRSREQQAADPLAAAVIVTALCGAYIIEAMRG